MASVTKRGQSYKITVSCGLDSAGKQIRKSITYKPEPGMTEKQIEKAVQREAVLFEERCRTGKVLAGNIRFSEFAKIWLEKYGEEQLKETTLARYKGLLVRICAAIGHIRLEDLQPHHFMEFYKNLSEEGVRDGMKYHTRIDFKALLDSRGINISGAAKKASVSTKTIAAAMHGSNISKESAEKISEALESPLPALFEPVKNEEKLSQKTILHHHRLISSILQTAVVWQVIPSNPCNRVKAPRVQRKEAPYMDVAEAVKVLQELDNQDIGHKAMIYTLLYSGMRRGELCGLEWDDIDFDHDMLNISRNSVYVSGSGIITTTPKTEKSVRVEKVPHVVIEVLKEHQHEQKLQRLSVGADWVENNRVFTQWNGKPIFPDSISQWFKKFLERSGLDGRGYSLKALRHTAASLMIASRVDVRTVAARLGHAQTSTTTNIYAHLIRSADERAAEAIDDLLAGRGK